MSAGRIMFDGHDLANYGGCVVRGGYNTLVQWPALKKVNSNDWFEEDGLECDLSAPVLEARDVTLKMSFSSVVGFKAFLELMQTKQVHACSVPYIFRSYSLRYVGCSSVDNLGRLVIAQVRFVEDNPMKGYSYQTPTTSRTADSRYSFIRPAPNVDILLEEDGAAVITNDGDAIYFTAEVISVYGIRVLKGVHAEALKAGEVKQPMVRNIQSNIGNVIDKLAPVHYKNRDLKLVCHMHEPTLSGLWRNYDALLYDLIRPGERIVSIGPVGMSFRCHYKSCSVSEFAPAAAWIKFTITLNIIGEYNGN